MRHVRKSSFSQGSTLKSDSTVEEPGNILDQYSSSKRRAPALIKISVLCISQTVCIQPIVSY
jgi:hypothetical protein